LTVPPHLRFALAGTPRWSIAFSGFVTSRKLTSASVLFTQAGQFPGGPVRPAGPERTHNGDLLWGPRDQYHNDESPDDGLNGGLMKTGRMAYVAER